MVAVFVCVVFSWSISLRFLRRTPWGNIEIEPTFRYNNRVMSPMTLFFVWQKGSGPM